MTFAFTVNAQNGDYCGYSWAFETQHDNTKLAVVDVGYGDGILLICMTFAFTVNAC
jgi:alanine racemase